MRTVNALLLAAGLLGSLPCFAQPWNPIGRTDAKGNPGNVRIEPGLGVPITGDVWNDTLAQKIYDSKLGPRPAFALLEFIWPLYEWMNDVDNTIAQKIADGCRTAYANDSWRQIRCASEAVELLLRDHEIDSSIRTPCRSHARAFKEVVHRLDIPGVRVGEFTMPGHVLNRLFVTTPSGQVLQYAYDVGWNEDTVYPLSEQARRWHDRNNDGITDFASLPPLPTQGQRINYAFYAAAPSATGSNIGRDAATRGATGSTTGSTAGRAAGAGIPR